MLTKRQEQALDEAFRRILLSAGFSAAGIPNTFSFGSGFTGANIFQWSLDKSWEQVWADASVAGGGVIMVHGDLAGAARQMPVGSYDISKFHFVGVDSADGFQAQVSVPAGTTLSNGTALYMRLDNVWFNFNGPVNGTATVVDIYLSRFAALNMATDASLATGVTSLIVDTDRGNTIQGGATNAMFVIAAGGIANCQINAVRGSVISGSIFGSADGLTTPIIACDTGASARTVRNITNLSIAPCPAPSFTTSTLVVPNSTTPTQGTTSSAGSVGRALYDTTLNKFLVNDGTLYAEPGSYRFGIASGAISANQVLVEDVTANNFKTAPAGTVAKDVRGFSLAAVASTKKMVVETGVGRIVTVISDGTGSIAIGDDIQVSATVAGQVMKSTAGARIGVAITSAAAVAGTTFSMLYTGIPRTSSTTGTAGTWVAGVGSAVNRDSTTDGGLGGTAYNISDIVRALKLNGTLAL